VIEFRICFQFGAVFEFGLYMDKLSVIYFNIGRSYQ